MMTVNTKDIYNTEKGQVVIIEEPTETLKKGDKITINGKIKTIKNIMLSSRPQENEKIGVYI